MTEVFDTKTKVFDSDMVTVAIAVIKRSDGKVLLGHRRDDHYRRPGEWEFPGGKAEKGETPQQAVVREAFEETNLKVSVVKDLMSTTCDYPDGKYRYVRVFAVAPETDDPQPVSTSGDYVEFRWVDPTDKTAWSDNRIPPTDRAILNQAAFAGEL